MVRELASILVGDHLGQVKKVLLNSGEISLLPDFAEPSRSNPVVSIEPLDENAVRHLIAYKNGNIYVHDSVKNKTKCHNQKADDSLIRALVASDGDVIFIYEKRLVFDYANKTGDRQLKFKKGQIKDAKARDGKLAVVGKDIPLKVFDLKTRNKVYEADLPEKDWLRIQPECDVVGLDFVGPDRIATCSKSDSVIRVYDIKSEKTCPIININLGQTAFNEYAEAGRFFSVASAKKEGRSHKEIIVVGSNVGQLIAIELRPNVKQKPNKKLQPRTHKILGGFKGARGAAIKDIVIVDAGSEGDTTNYKASQMAIECTYCEEKVNSKRGIYVKCTTCQDIKLCLECFSAGAEIGEHQSDHPYELVDCGSFSIIDETWKAYEELALLEAIELYGIGSWTDISNAVGTRSAEECCERYLRVYVDNFFGRCTWNAIDKNLYTVKDHTCLHDQPLSPSLSLPEREKIVDISREQQIRLGYMPKRDDFEREYDNDAELLVSKLAVNANDDTEQLDQELKIAHINMYTDKLRERFRRKRIVLEYNLVKLFFHMHPEENLDGVSHPNQLNAIHHNSKSHESSTMSITTAAANAPINKTDHEDLTRWSNIPTSRNQITDNQTSNSNIKSPSKPGQATILNYFRRLDPASRRDSSDSTETSILSSYFSDLNRSIDEQEFNTMEKKLRIFCQFGSAGDHNRLVRNLAREREIKTKIKELMEKKKNGSVTATPSKSTTDGCWRLLSESEKRLCKSLNLKAEQYLSIKAAIIKDCKDHKRKKGIAQKLAADGNIDKSVRKKIVNFLSRHNWIKV